MVGRTGVIEAAVKAVETVDGCLGRVVETVATTLLEDDGSPNTAHSMNPVPLIVTADVGELREGGILADVAPTILGLLGRDNLRR